MEEKNESTGTTIHALVVDNVRALVSQMNELNITKNNFITLHETAGQLILLYEREK